MKLQIETDRKFRSSNFEMLRLILIFLIILGHANVWFFGSYYKTETEHIIKIMVQVICLPAVDTFVLISGWFGIKANMRKFFAIIFQLLFCTVPVAIFMSIMGYVDILSIDGIRVYVLGGDNYWFIIAYIGLLLFVPVLNIVVLNAAKKVLQVFLISVMVFIILIDLIIQSNALGVGGGYSLLWFIYLYLLGRYMRIYGIGWLEKHKWNILIICFILQTVLLYFHLTSNRYTNPLILFPAISMILITKGCSFQNNVVNYVATATLMAYMLHLHPCFWHEIGAFLHSIYQADGYYLYLLEVMGLIVLLYIVALVCDKLQAMLWKHVSKLIF